MAERGPLRPGHYSGLIEFSPHRRDSMQFRITEVQNAQSHRGRLADVVINASSLTAAKRHARRIQMFQGTVLIVRSENNVILSSWDGDRWIDNGE